MPQINDDYYRRQISEWGNIILKNDKNQYYSNVKAADTNNDTEKTANQLSGEEIDNYINNVNAWNLANNIDEDHDGQVDQINLQSLYQNIIKNYGIDTNQNQVHINSENNSLVEYDGNGNEISKTIIENGVTTKYSNLNKFNMYENASETDQNGVVAQKNYIFDDNGNQLGVQVIKNGVTTNWNNLNKFNRFEDGVETDQNGVATKAFKDNYDDNGNMKSRIEADLTTGITTQYEYLNNGDEDSRTTSETKTLNGIVIQRTNNEYDEFGNLKRTVTIDYNSDGTVKSETVTENGK